MHYTHEQLEEIKELDLQTKSFCTKCNTNWARLHSARHGDIEFCPTCNSDMDLVEGKEGGSFLCDPITGAVYNVKTKEEKLYPSPTPPPMVDRRSFTERSRDIENNRFLKMTGEEKNQLNDEFLKQYGL